MPGNVAVEKPGAGVVGLEGHHDPAPGRQHRCVATRRVVAIERGCVGRGVVGAQSVAARLWVRKGLGGTENEDVMALQVRRSGDVPTRWKLGARKSLHGGGWDAISVRKGK